MMRMMKLKSLRAKLLLYFIPVSVSVLVISGFIIALSVRTGILEQTMESTEETLHTSVRIVEEMLAGIKTELRNLANTDVVKSFDPTRFVPRFVETIKQGEGLYETFFLADPTGKAIMETGEAVDIRDRPYFQEVMFQGKKFAINDGMISRFAHIPAFGVAYPVYDYTGQLIGVLGANVALKTLSEKVCATKIGQTGYIFLVDGSGTVIAHPDTDLILNLNLLEGTKSKYKGLEEAGREMVSGREGFGNIVLPSGEKQILHYDSIPNTPNWTVAGVISEAEVTQKSAYFLVTVVVIFAVIVGVIVLISMFVGSFISKSLKRLSAQVDQFGKGDLTTVFEVKGRDEIAQIAQALSEMGNDLREAMVSIGEASQEIKAASTDLAAISEEQLAGSEELSSQSASVNSNLQNTVAAIEEVNSGVDEVAASAQNVSKTAQALSTENNKTADGSREGGQMISDVVRQIEATTQQTLLTAERVQKLAENSKSVGEIVDTISSIAEQTNLLALNAAIEAARAGEAGRGFAVVADEIRKLAEESKRATSNIGAILKEIKKDAEESYQATDKTVSLVKDVNTKSQAVEKQFKHLLDMVEKTTGMIENLTGTSEEQGAAAEEMASAMDTSAKAAHEISEQIRQMAQGIEQQTQGAHQISSDAEELDSLAENLDTQIKRFKV